MSERLARAFADHRPALVTFVTAGDPTPDATGAILDALVAGGANVIELGMPFTDPMADGPAIQAAKRVERRSMLTFPLPARRRR